MVIGLVICSVKARKSDKAISRTVSWLLLSLIPPIVGNLIIIGSTTELPAVIGCYIYFLGLDITIAYVLKFTIEYCNYSWDNKIAISAVYSLLTIDFIQYACNPFTGHAFTVQQIFDDARPYYQLVPGLGQTYHRIVVYGFFFASLVLFAIKAIRISRVYIDRYVVILISMVIGGAWETFYIFSGTPVDTSMIGFGIFGFLVFYFSIYYKPRILVDKMLSSIASNLPEALMLFDMDHKCVWVNDPAVRMFGIDKSDLSGVRELLMRTFPKVAERDGEWKSHQVIGSGRDAKHYYLEKHVASDDRGNISGYFISVLDNTVSQQKLDRERRNARHDSLTGLYNKDYLFKCIRTMLAKHPGVPFQVAFVDVNEFKMVNDVFGKEFGDHALKTIADWIADGMSDMTVYGRLGGDTFGVCQPVDEFDPVRLNEVLSNFVVSKDGREHHMLMHIGVYQIDDPTIDVSIMFDRARMALTKIKRTYSHISYYNDSIKEMMLWNQQISAQLDEAIKERQIVPYLQPIVDAHGKVVGAEALARWIHPEKGFLSPASFIPVFEQNGKIVEVDRYIWRCACELLKGWESIHPDLFLSVNISPIDFYYMDLCIEMDHLVKEFGIDPHNLRLEITESVMMTNIEERIITINKLREAGFIIEMDDFGSGYSSLNLLKDMPADLIKVDMAFLRKAQDDKRADIILDSVIKLIESLGIISLTEGVETDAQFKALANMGCKLFQGFHFAKPLPVDEFEKYCEEA